MHQTEGHKAVAAVAAADDNGRNDGARRGRGTRQVMIAPERTGKLFFADFLHERVLFE
jgi:hypothetical protein